MIDAATRQPLQVIDGGQAGPYLVIRIDQLDPVLAALDEASVDYWVDEEAVSVDGDPEVTFVNFSEDTNRQSLQHLLDRLP